MLSNASNIQRSMTVSRLQLDLITYESINKCEFLETSCLYSGLALLSIFKLQYRKPNFYINLLLLLSGNISLNPDLPHNDQLQPQRN